MESCIPHSGACRRGVTKRIKTNKSRARLGGVRGISEVGKFIYIDVDIDIGIIYDINID